MTDRCASGIYSINMWRQTGETCESHISWGKTNSLKALKSNFCRRNYGNQTREREATRWYETFQKCVPALGCRHHPAVMTGSSWWKRWGHFPTHGLASADSVGETQNFKYNLSRLADGAELVFSSLVNCSKMQIDKKRTSNQLEFIISQRPAAFFSSSVNFIV